MAPETRKSDLTPRQRLLVERMQRIRYGRIENLVVRDGEPVIEPGTTKVIRSIRFEKADGPHPGLDRDDTILKAKVVNLLRLLDEIGFGMIQVLHFGDGLPGTMEIEERTDDEPNCTVGSVPPSNPPPISDDAVEKIDSGSRP